MCMEFWSRNNMPVVVIHVRIVVPLGRVLLIRKGREKYSGSKEMFYILIWVLVTHVYAKVKILLSTYDLCISAFIYINCSQ